MIECDGWEQQPGGLYLAVQKFNKFSPEHRDAAAGIMRSTVKAVSQTHGASFSEADFRNNMQALYSGDIEIDLFLAKWEVCNRKPAVPVIVGAALNWGTIGIDPTGRSVKARYTEDVCMLNGSLRQLIGTKPKGSSFPDESLAACFERLTLQNMMAEGDYYRYGEVNHDNTKMMRTLDGNGAMIGLGPDSAVLEFKSLAGLYDRFLIDLPAIELRKRGVRDENNFIVRWKDGPFDIRFIATRGQATAAGHPRADIRVWHNGYLPEQALLESIVASALFSIKNEAGERDWGTQGGKNYPSPIIPLLAARPDIYRALYGACGNEIAIAKADRPKTFDQALTDAHVYIINDQQMLDAFMAVGAAPRLFGSKPMVPGVNVLRSEHRLAS